MSSAKQKLRLAGAFAALATLALAVSCTGFFVNPTLTAVSVGPSGLNLNVGQTFSMVATGTYSDGSQKTLTSGVVWSSDDQSTVSVGQSSGVVDGLEIGSANITASSGGCSSCSGSTSVTVVLNDVTSITVIPRRSKCIDQRQRRLPLRLRPTPVRLTSRRTQHGTSSTQLTPT